MRTTLTLLAIATAALITNTARADEWTGTDKQQHAITCIGAAAGSASVLAADSLLGRLQIRSMPGGGTEVLYRRTF